ncbi:hypothetical protein V2I01_21140 [Micromonospora sp. BRA006-A]|nr:hypothetical protein [Micromonospora sp. BRA006-A]
MVVSTTTTPACAPLRRLSARTASIVAFSRVCAGVGASAVVVVPAAAAVATSASTASARGIGVDAWDDAATEISCGKGSGAKGYLRAADAGTAIPRVFPVRLRENTCSPGAADRRVPFDG